MKILEIDYEYYYYPEGITCAKEFIDYVNDHYNSFVELTQFETENCVFPYFVKEETTKVYVNVANLNKIHEVEATILHRLDYDARLKQVVEKKCVDCINYEEGDDLEGHRDKLSLDGECPLYHKKND